MRNAALFNDLSLKLHNIHHVTGASNTGQLFLIRAFSPIHNRFLPRLNEVHDCYKTTDRHKLPPCRCPVRIIAIRFRKGPEITTIFIARDNGSCKINWGVENLCLQRG